MELFTTATLWKNYDRRAQPLEQTVISSEKQADRTVEYVFFNGDPCADGCTRIFSRYYRPEKANGAGVVVMNDVMDVFDETYVNLLSSAGYCVLVVDYVGKRRAELYTVYPHSLTEANYFVCPDAGLNLPDNPKQSCWYVWATLMLRGVTFLENRPEITRKISVFGVKTGAFQVWKAAYVDDNLACGVALFNSGYINSDALSGTKQMQYNICIDNSPYAGDIRVPVLAEVASNARDNSIEYMSDLTNNVRNNSCFFAIGERRCGLLSDDQIKNIRIFVDECNFGEIEKLPRQPEIVARESGRSLFYDVKIDSSLSVSDVRLFVSEGDMPFAYKNWHRYPLSFLQDGSYMARVNVYAPKERMCAFVTVSYENGFSVTSELVQNIPFLMKVKPTDSAKAHLLYSVEDGVDDWTVLGGHGEKGSLSPYIEEGEYGLKGVTSDFDTLSTFKFGEFRYKMEGKSYIQVTVYIESDMRVSVTVTEKREGDYLNFTHSVHLRGYKEWIKVNLRADEFRCGALRLENFDDISCFTIESDGKLLLNSVILV